MSRLSVAAYVILFWAASLFAAQSTITEAEGTASMGDDKTRKQTEQNALAEAKRNAVEYTVTYLKSETRVKNGVVESDLIEAFSKASVNVVQVLERKWYRDEALGDCFMTRIKAEVIPDEKALAAQQGTRAGSEADDPTALLTIRAWADKGEYKTGETVKFFIKGNRPFYARVTYTDASGSVVQLLPNPFRTGNYFNGGAVYEMPSGEDQFELKVSPPYGAEKITVYASTAQLGDVDLQAAGGVYEVKTKASEVGNKTRGIKIQKKDDGKATPAEFAETGIGIKTIK
jgi:hypothetical protein